MLLAASLQAEVPTPTATSTRTPEELDQLLAPIALYPDPLVALILPAAAAPTDVVLATRYLAANGDLAQLDSQAWDDAVKGLAHYRDVLVWMDQNLEWTAAVGAAFTAQPADVMKSIQQLRARALATGVLVDTPQQHIVVENGEIRILPAQPDTIFVPRYNPQIVYLESPPSAAGRLEPAAAAEGRVRGLSGSSGRRGAAAEPGEALP